jgi:hypothetical protein
MTKLPQLDSDFSGNNTVIVSAKEHTQAETVCSEAWGHVESTTLYIQIKKMHKKETISLDFLENRVLANVAYIETQKCTEY